MSKHESNRSSAGRQKIRKVIKAGNKKLPSRRGWGVSSQAEPDYNEALEEGNVVANDDMGYDGALGGMTDYDREQKEYGNTLANASYYESVGNNATRGTARSRRTARGLAKTYQSQLSDKQTQIIKRHHDEMGEDDDEPPFYGPHGKAGADNEKYLSEWGGDPGYDYATETRGQQSMIDYIQDNIARSHKIDAIMGKDFSKKNGYRITADDRRMYYPFNMNGMQRKGITKHFDQSGQHPAIAYDQGHPTKNGDGYMEPSDEDDREQVDEGDKNREY